jgi:hypothetical protein
MKAAATNKRPNMKEDDMPDTTNTPAVDTLKGHLTTMKNQVAEAWKAGNEADLVALRNRIVALRKVSNEIQSAYDAFVDSRDAGMFGADYVTEVTRIRAKSDKVGRPATPKPQAIDAL